MTPIYLELIDSHGSTVWSGGSSYYASPIPSPAPGLYFVRIILPETSTDFALTAAWGSNGQGTLQNGVPLTGLSGNQDDVLLQSVYVPENTHALMFQASFDTDAYLELIDSHGSMVWSGGSSYYASPIPTPAAGLYFVRIILPEDATDFALTAAWGSNGQGTLQNGIPLTGLSGNQDDVLLQSVYVPENTNALVLQTGSDTHANLELVHIVHGTIWSGTGNDSNPLQNPPAGLYFVRIYLAEDISDFSLTAILDSGE